MSQKLRTRQQKGAALQGALTMLCEQAEGPREMHKSPNHRRTQRTPGVPQHGSHARDL